jgi:phosphotransferase system enzyme I (PtsI)
MKKQQFGNWSSSLKLDSVSEMAEQKITGIAASEGIQMGRAYLYRLKLTEDAPIVEAINEDQVDSELEKLRAAKAAVAKQLDDIMQRNHHRFEEQQQAILIGHKSLLDDPAFIGDMEKQIRKRLLSAEKAAQTVIDKWVKMFQGMDKEYLRERAQDIQDIGGRLMDVLQGKTRGGLDSLEGQHILVAHDITPSDAMQMNPQNILGFLTRIGGKTSHTAILARSMEIPALVGMSSAIDRIKQGDFLIIDGKEGVCLINPSPSTIAEYQEKQAAARKEKEMLETYRHELAETLDGAAFELAANIGSAQESQMAVSSGAEGVGLFRTEFMYMHTDRMPSEDQQFAVYKEILSMWQNKPVVIRTLDIGGDKELPYLSLEKETNPFLGYRAIRIGLNQPEVLRIQLRAILRASAFGTARIMFPMISSIEEWRQAKSITVEIMKELESEGIAYDRSIQLGIMAEIPSVVQIADLFAKEVDFFSIGTNDLVQYTLAVDRMNEKVAYLYDYFHPAVLRAIRTIIDAAHAEGKWVGMCGGMAGDPLAAPILIALGLDEWSMEPSAINRVKAKIRNFKRTDCLDFMNRIWQQSTTKEVRETIDAFIGIK